MGPQTSTLREWLEAEPFSLCMSSGFFSFFAHTGMLLALEQAETLPCRVSGASAGGLVAGCWAAGLDAPAIREDLLALRREDFWDPWPGAGLLRGRKFLSRLHHILPTARFEDCRVPVAVSVFDVLTRSTVVLGDGELAPSIAATCAVPGLFQPVWIRWRPYLDGGIADRPALHTVRHGERVLMHHIASRSPWRRKGSHAIQPPRLEHGVTLVIEGLTRAGPFKLAAGHSALEQANRATLAALDRPIVDGLVVVHADEL